MCVCACAHCICTWSVVHCQSQVLQPFKCCHTATHGSQCSFVQWQPYTYTHTLTSHTVTHVHPRHALQDHDEAHSEITKKTKMESMLVKMQMIRAGTLNPADLTTEENRCLWQRLKTAMGQHNPEAEQASAMWQEINASGSGKDAKNKMLLQAWCMS